MTGNNAARHLSHRGSNGGELPNRVTVSEVLKYSLTWVTIPLAETMQALSGSEWKSSVITVEPKEVMESETKRKVLSDVVEEVPVRRRIKNLWDGTITRGWGEDAMDGIAVAELEGLVQGADHRTICGLMVLRMLKKKMKISARKVTLKINIIK